MIASYWEEKRSDKETCYSRRMTWFENYVVGNRAKNFGESIHDNLLGKIGDSIELSGNSAMVAAGTIVNHVSG
jgi:hypothetical protein